MRRCVVNRKKKTGFLLKLPSGDRVYVHRSSGNDLLVVTSDEENAEIVRSDELVHPEDLEFVRGAVRELPVDFPEIRKRLLEDE